jgi:hypothetical protein
MAALDVGVLLLWAVLSGILTSFKLKTDKLISCTDILHLILYYFAKGFFHH